PWAGARTDRGARGRDACPTLQDWWQGVDRSRRRRGPHADRPEGLVHLSSGRFTAANQVESVIWAKGSGRRPPDDPAWRDDLPRWEHHGSERRPPRAARSVSRPADVAEW